MNNIKEKMSAVLNGIGIVTVLLLLCTIFAIKAPGFVSVRNLYYILQQVSVVGILVIGVIGFLLSTLMRGVESRLCAWSRVQD